MNNKFLKKIGTVCLASSLFVASAFSGCMQKDEPFVWGETPPESVAIGAELFFRNYIEIEDDEDEGTHLCSYDTYYPRTPERDKVYEKEYGMRMNVDGRRIRATKCARTYAK
jgi:hypothetical protein